MIRVKINGAFECWIVCRNYCLRFYLHSVPQFVGPLQSICVVVHPDWCWRTSEQPAHGFDIYRFTWRYHIACWTCHGVQRTLHFTGWEGARVSWGHLQCLQAPWNGAHTLPSVAKATSSNTRQESPPTTGGSFCSYYPKVRQGPSDREFFIWCRISWPK